MKMYAVTNADETAYYSHGYENLHEAQRALDFALQHDPKAHIKEYEIETPQERCGRLQAELEQVKQERDGLSIMLTSATSAAETYKRERDELLFELTQLANGFGDECDCCRFAERGRNYIKCKRPEIIAEETGDEIEGGTLICVWQWRGLCAENGGEKG